MDPRPITISEFFSKVLGNLAMMKSTSSLHRCQRGMHHKGGTHQAIVEVQTAYDNGEGERKIVATFDVSNAYNATMRAKIYEKLQSMGAHAQYLLDYFRWMYGVESDIYIRAKGEYLKYRSREGVRQGDMPAALLFCLVFTDAALEACDGVLDNPLVALWLYMDDITVVGTVTQILQYKVKLELSLVKLGLKLNMKKSRALVDRCTDAEIELLRLAGFQLDRGTTRVLGSPVGDPTKCAEWVQKKVDGWGLFWARLRSDFLRPATALQLLEKCGNVKFEHLAKSLHPDVTREAAGTFDDEVIKTAKQALGIHGYVDVNVLRAALHLRPYRVVSEPLYRCTVDLTAARLSSVKEEVMITLKAYYAGLGDLPFIEAHVRAVQGETAADVLYSSAPLPGNPISTHHFAQGMRLRVGVLPDRLPHECDGCNLGGCNYYYGALPEPRAALCHLVNCNGNFEKTSTTRHNQVLQSIIDVLHLYGIRSTRHGLDSLDVNGKLVVDLEVFLRKRILLDVTVVDDVHGFKDALKKATDEKHAKYDDFAEGIGRLFFAIPMSAYGHLGSDTHRFIAHVARAVHVARRSEFKKTMRCALQHALLVGTSEVIDHTLQRLAGADRNFLA